MTVVWEGKYLAAHKEGTWEYVARRGGIGAAVIVAVHEEHLILVEQHRVPLGRACLELPAGLVGDEDADEAMTDAAARELEEETGYRPDHVEDLGFFYSSPGMSSEGFNLVRASGLTRVSDGGGHEGENITVHRVALAQVPAFIAQKRGEGLGIDAKLLYVLGAGLA